MTGRRLRTLAIRGVFVLGSLALSHEVIYLLAHGLGNGYASAMREGGHDRYWTSFLLVVALVTSGLAIVAVTQFRRLHRLAAGVHTGSVRLGDGGLDRFPDLLRRLLFRVSTGTAVAYVLQENAETASTGAALPGLGVLGGEHAIAVPVLLAVGLLVSVIGALVGWRREILLARIRAAAGGRFRVTARVLRPAFASDRPTGRCEGRRHGVRAPPGGLIQPA